MVASEDAKECQGCAIFWEAVRPFLHGDGESPESPVFAKGYLNDNKDFYAISVKGIEGHSRLEEAGEAVAIVLTGTQGVSNAWGMKHMEFTEFAEAYDPGSDIVQHQQSPIIDLGDSTLSPQTVQVSKMWLDSCLQHYSPFCNRGQVSALPRRVLGFDQEENGTIRLHEFDCAHERPKAPYMCLSYCWGGADFIRLTKGNCENLKERIPSESLPRLFRDFISLARKLGIFYVWIDSLCIVQDDLNDWKVEAARMAEIYSQSLLTVSATGGRDPSWGLEYPRPDEDIVCGQIRRRVIRVLPEILSPSFPVMGRAWCFQERLLSPRVLHFGPEGVFWECATGTLSEYGNSHDFTTYGGLNRQRFCDACSSCLNAGDSWRNIVQHYTALSMTNPTDRLPAIMGLSVALRDYGRRDELGEYLSGLWEKSLLTDFLWERLLKTTSLVPQKSTGSTLAPSWSWASISGPVIYSEPVRRSFGFITKCCRVLHIQTGDLTKVQIRCQLVAGSVVDHVVVEGVEEGLPLWDNEESSNASQLYRLPVVVDDVMRLSKAREPIFLVRVAMCVSTVFFLVVRTVDGREDFYERVGLVKVSVMKSELNWIHEETQWENIRWHEIFMI
ncbi:unnamed protein product [Clonostachys rosea]|uniref:Heterokaryon incompatibility domain-containing protein n=1 Tax=Bionectria ochroleuca TaxID=29856 RepID=A0ABY6UK86_BIOOC|nr:unnamed protein product [Clonostachys rosea]